MCSVISGMCQCFSKDMCSYSLGCVLFIGWMYAVIGGMCSVLVLVHYTFLVGMYAVLGGN